MKIIQEAMNKGQKALSEFQSKKLLAAYGIPITVEYLAKSLDDGIALSERIGYPVVLKACSPDLMHKSESGGVELNLKNHQDIRAAYERIIKCGEDHFEGVLVQEMVNGPREIVMGMKRDAQFGPVVMLGLGGIMTEILKDITFRVAPFNRVEAEDMTAELRSRAVFKSFRGQAAADVETICRSLVALGELALENETIAEIDINPLIIDPNGNVKAVDALVVLQAQETP